MAEEQSIRDQIHEMYQVWAVVAKEKADSGDYEKAKELLQKINTQGRKLEWRNEESGGLRGILMFKGENLIRKVSEARAASQQALTFITYLNNAQKAIEQLTTKIKADQEKLAAAVTKKRRDWYNAEIQAAKNDLRGNEKKRSNYKMDIGKNISILIKVLEEAQAILKAGPSWLPKKVIQHGW